MQDYIEAQTLTYLSCCQHQSCYVQIAGEVIELLFFTFLLLLEFSLIAPLTDTWSLSINHVSLVESLTSCLLISFWKIQFESWVNICCSTNCGITSLLVQGTYNIITTIFINWLAIFLCMCNNVQFSTPNLSTFFHLLQYYQIVMIAHVNRNLGYMKAYEFQPIPIDQVWQQSF